MPIIGRYPESRNETAAVNDGYFAEPIRHVKKVETNQYSLPVDGVVTELMAVVRFGGRSDDLGGGRNRNFTSKISMGEGRMMIDPVAYPTASDIAQDDIIVLLSRPGEPEFTVGRIDPVSSSRLTFYLVKS